MEKVIDDLEKKVVPNSLQVLTSRHSQLASVIQYLEETYLVTEPNSTDRAAVQDMAKRYLADALVAVVTDIGNAAGNIEKFVDLQTQALESLDNQMDLITARLQMCKEQHAVQRLDTMRHKVEPSSSAPSRKLEGEEAPEQAAPFVRTSVSRRLLKYEGMGVTFEGRRTADSSSSPVDSSRRISLMRAPPPPVSEQP